MEQLEYSEEWGDRLQQDYDEYMDRLWESVDSEEFDPEAGTDVTGTPFCGCETCERRASWSWLLIRGIKAYREGSLKLEVVDDVLG